MKEIILQKCNFRCRENIYICRPLRRLRRLAVEYVKNMNLLQVIKYKMIYMYSCVLELQSERERRYISLSSTYYFFLAGYIDWL